jgi:hypothetical protein
VLLVRVQLDVGQFASGEPGSLGRRLKGDPNLFRTSIATEQYFSSVFDLLKTGTYNFITL